MKTYSVLIIEDEPTINRMVSNYFKVANFIVHSALNGLEGLTIFNNESIDIVCLDVMLPNMNGWTIAKKIRETSNTPIIMMSALSEEEDILKGYSLKVDDYITKPFNPRVLIAKAQSILNRMAHGNDHLASAVLSTKHVTVNTHTHKVFIDDIEVEMSKTEFELLAYFIRHEGRICSRNHLLDEIWGIDVFVEDRIVDTYVKRLRKHLGPYAHYIKTVFGVGYRFESHDK